MSWGEAASGIAVVLGGAILYIRDTRKSKAVDEITAQPGIALFIQSIQDDNKDLRVRLERSEARVDKCEQEILDLKEELKKRFRED